ncbi:uncharacterized protein LOC121256461 isoform X1 [Juglans microcarpa x Juglans regia]|uniref:uncharacterized protein LOC121256461 isoform X1 n=1 Tax=Juglans microcarpa x Juglans regia TaxID=2249226 RepID=UPI001B7EA1E1|nr:uncharacterized protein LOC121256461 isoform X1 [Juglans microcarpa x Juglans regia]
MQRKKTSSIKSPSSSLFCARPTSVRELPCMRPTSATQGNSSACDPPLSSHACIPCKPRCTACSKNRGVHPVHQHFCKKLISLENGELSAPADNNHISVDMNYCDVVDVHLIIEGESLQDHWTFCSHEIFAESLI